MADDRINDDFSRRVVLAIDSLPWRPSPLPGVARRMLDRIGGEVARATSLVRYAPDSRFSAHRHDLGEEFLVLEGVFSDEHGDYPAGSYVRNPPGSSHSPYTKAGCTIFVKLRQMTVQETERTVLPPAEGSRVLFDAPAQSELVQIAALSPGQELEGAAVPGGEEILVLSGAIEDEAGAYPAPCWIRNPAGYRRRIRSTMGATLWIKRGHLIGL